MIKAVQAKDIKDSDMCLAIYQGGLALLKRWGKPEVYCVSAGNYGGTWSYRPDVESILTSIAGRGYPAKVVLAKVKSLIRRDMVDGCGCGCRGDWQLMKKGMAEISHLFKVAV